jgi:hypothetical protein
VDDCTWASLTMHLVPIKSVAQDPPALCFIELQLKIPPIPLPSAKKVNGVVTF